MHISVYTKGGPDDVANKGPFLEPAVAWIHCSLEDPEDQYHCSSAWVVDSGQVPLMLVVVGKEDSSAVECLKQRRETFDAVFGDVLPHDVVPNVVPVRTAMVQLARR